MTFTLRPMLAAKDASKIKYPVLVSPKLDGIRALVRDGVVLSRTLKPIPNAHVQRLFGHLHGLDGELIVGEPFGTDVMQRTTSGVMSKDGEPDVTFWVFDCWDMPLASFVARLSSAETTILKGALESAKKVPHYNARDEGELLALEELFLSSGYEGAMVRDPYGLYKYGRSTAKEGGLVKVKRFEDSEAKIVGFEERMHNDNEATTDSLGHTKRSTHQENKRPAGDLGALICETPEGVRFNIGTGFTAGQRQLFWEGRDALLGLLVKYKHFSQTGVKEAPRFPVFLGFRHEIDYGGRP